jgi:hypothetical protein
MSTQNFMKPFEALFVHIVLKFVLTSDLLEIMSVGDFQLYVTLPGPSQIASSSTYFRRLVDQGIVYLCGAIYHM